MSDTLVNNVQQNSIPQSSYNLAGVSPGQIQYSPQHQQKFNLSGTFSGALSGLMSGNPWGAAVGAGIGLVKDIVQNRLNKKRTDQANQVARENAEIDFERQKALQKESENYNSEQAKVNRMLQAGLNPALLYQTMGNSSVSTPGSSMAQNSDPKNVDLSSDARLLEFMQLVLSNRQGAAQIDNLNSQTEGNQIDNQTKNTSNLAKIANLIASTANLESSSQLNEEQRKMIADSKTLLLEKYKAEIAKDLSSIDLNESVISKNTQDIKESNSRIDLNSSVIDRNNQEIQESVSRIGKNSAETAYIKQQRLQALLDYGLKRNEAVTMSKWLRDHNIPTGLTGAVMEAVKNFSQQSGKTVPEVIGHIAQSWTSAENILPFISNNRRNEVMRELGLGGIQSDGEPIVKQTPNNSSYTKAEQEVINHARSRVRQLSPQQMAELAEFKKDHNELEVARWIIQHTSAVQNR